MQNIAVVEYRVAGVKAYLDLTRERIVLSRVAFGVCAGAPVGAGDDKEGGVLRECDIVLGVELAARGGFLGEELEFLLGRCGGPDVVSVPF